MVVDTSALVAIYLREPEHPAFESAIDQAPAVFLSVVSRVELTAVLSGGRVAATPDEVANFVDSLSLELMAVDAGQADLAVRAILTFGKGRHPARLNLGDCFAYALAKSLDAPLLFKGEDFARTDIVPAWRPTESPGP